MRKVVHTRRPTIALAAALVMALALPVAIPVSRGGGEAAASGSAAPPEAIVADVSAPPVRLLTGTPEQVTDAAQTASMMIVGTLLIGIGSIVRRAL